MSKKSHSPFDAATFFDRYSDTSVYGDTNVRGWVWECDFVRFIKEHIRPKSALLDVGAGSGTFANLVKLHVPSINITALDPSVKLLNKIEDPAIDKVVGQIPDLCLDKKMKFFFIHVKNVLHHLVGRTTNQSSSIVKESLLALKVHLDDSGFLMIHDEYWETYAVPSASRTFVFFFLSVANILNIKLPHRWHLQGLNVCFYTTLELQKMLKDCGFEIVRFNTYPFADNRFKKLMFLKRWGRLSLIVKKATSDSQYLVQ